MICPNCREDNAPTFRFCGMCGTALEPRRGPGTPTLNPLAAFPPPPSQRVVNAEPPLTPVLVNEHPAAAQQEARGSNRAVPPISGPSMLGLNQPAVARSASDRPSPERSEDRSRVAATGADRPASHQHVPSMFDLSPAQPAPPSMDSLRERSFTGLDSFLETEEPKFGGRKIFMLLVLFAVLGVGGWWAYNNYSSLVQRRSAESGSPNPASPSAENPNPTTAAPASNSAAPASGAGASAPTPVPSSEVAEGPSENAGTDGDTSAKSGDSGAKPNEHEASPAPAAAIAPAKNPSKRHESKRQSVVASAARPRSAPEPPAADTGDSSFRKGEAYLYGRGVSENCDEAVKNLKAASAKSNAKARSAFGTMYATGHCVPRDLPTSYTWFALALRADPNNQILEKDLTAVWNQMTPPERQMATRMKQ